MIIRNDQTNDNQSGEWILKIWCLVIQQLLLCRCRLNKISSDGAPKINEVRIVQRMLMQCGLINAKLLGRCL